MASHAKILFPILTSLFLFFGCSQKQYFEPELINGKINFNGELPSPMVTTTKYGATLKNQQVLTSNGLGALTLKEGEIFVGFSQDLYILTSHCNNLLIFDSAGKPKASIQTPACALSATIKDDKLAVIFNNNSIALYELSTQKELFSKKNSEVLAVNSRIQAPIFSQNLIFFPTLDGSIIVVNEKKLEVEKSLIIDSAQFFNNVIFLEVQKDLILASTSKKILSIFNGNTYTIEEEARDLKVYNDRLYITTLDGSIKELDFTLKVLRSLKFPFASLPIVNISNRTIYLFEDGSGYLIKLSLKDFSPLIYKLKASRGENIFSQGNKIYYDDEFLEF